MLMNLRPNDPVPPVTRIDLPDNIQSSPLSGRKAPRQPYFAIRGRISSQAIDSVSTVTDVMRPCINNIHVVARMIIKGDAEIMATSDQ
jgi:hypothetical protein